MLFDILRTPYRIDILQPIYFVLESFEQIFELANQDLIPFVQKAQTLGLRPTTVDIRAIC